MPRPVKARHVRCNPEADYFKPRGIPVIDLEEVVLLKDELEAIRLADLHELYQQEAADNMIVSRQTFGNIIRSAHRKIADALVNGKALKIQGGVVVMEERQFQCQSCNHQWSAPFGTGRPANCPQCQGSNIFRASKGRGLLRGGGAGQSQRLCRRTNK